MNTSSRDFTSLSDARAFQRIKSTSGHNTRVYVDDTCTHFTVLWSAGFIETVK